MSQIDLKLIPQREALLERDDNTLHVLVRASAPAAVGADRVRSPLNLALVIDRSGSMSGRPLDEAKRCAGMIVDNLGAADRASLIAYDDTVSVLLPPQPLLDRLKFHTALQHVESGGSTDLHGGWLKGAELAAIGANDRIVSRVLLLSDGKANHGLTNPVEIARHCSEMANVGVNTSTYGLGEGFNEDLMSEMARSGMGNAYYGRTADDLIDPFRQEFDLLTALCGRSLRLSLSPATGIRVEVLNGYRTDAEGRSILPDLAYGSEAWALLRLTVPRDVLESPSGGDVHLLTTTLSYVDLEGHLHAVDPVHLRLPCLPAAHFETITTDKLVESRIAELRSAEIQDHARLAARYGDWERVENLLKQLRIEARDNTWLAASVAELERYAGSRETESFAKESAYKATAMRSRLSSTDESLDWSEGAEVKRSSFLRRKVEQGRRFPTVEDRKDG